MRQKKKSQASKSLKKPALSNGSLTMCHRPSELLELKRKLQAGAVRKASWKKRWGLKDWRAQDKQGNAAGLPCPKRALSCRRIVLGRESWGGWVKG